MPTHQTLNAARATKYRTLIRKGFSHEEAKGMVEAMYKEVEQTSAKLEVLSDGRIRSEVPHVETWSRLPVQAIAKLPEKPGVYCVFRSGDVAYIGMSEKGIRSRIKNHAIVSTLCRLGECVSVAYLVTDPTEVREVEAHLIQRFKPPLNSALKPR